jgi:ABC-type transport system substrate-binding protein
MDGAPASVDPAQASSIYANFLVVNLYDTLYRYRYLARPYELTPNLAAAMPELSEDGLTLTIRLKQGVHFHDDPAFAGGTGREVTAEDFVYSIQRHFDETTRAQGAWLWQERLVGLDAWKAAGSDYSQPVAGLRALDRYTIQLQLTRPYPQLVHTLAQGYAAVVPREAVETYGRQLGNHAVGSGPFRLKSLDSSRAVLERNANFRQEPFSPRSEGFDPDRDSGLGIKGLEGKNPPFLDRLEVEFVAEDASRWNAFYSGQTDFIKVPAAQFSQVLDSLDPPALSAELAERFHFEAAPEAGFVYTNFNMSDPAFGHHPDPQQDQRNRALRCAIIKGFDWQARNDMFFSGIGQVFPGIIPPRVPEFDPLADRQSIHHDVAGARQLLLDSNWDADSLPVLDYGYPSSVTERQMFDQFRSFMVEIGYPADKIRPQVFATFGDYLRAYSQRKLSLITTSWTMDYPDAENTIQLFYGPNAAPGTNSGNFDDPQFNAWFEAAAPLGPSAERTRLYRQMNQRVVEECAAITGLSRTLLFLWNKEALMRPDRSFVGGYYLRFVDMQGHGSE